MALFKSAEEKAEAQAQKEQKLLEKYGLQTLRNPEDIASVKRIAQELLGTGLMDAGMKLSMGVKTEDQLQVQFQRSIMEQNFIIIRQLDRIATLLEEK